MTALGMILFISSEVMFFGALFGAYFMIRAQHTSWPPPGSPEVDLAIPLALTVVLLTSSVSQHRAAAAARRGERERLTRLLAVTILLGALFLIGQAIEYGRLDASIDTNAFTSLFFTITGFHGLHVAGGLVALGLTYGRARRGAFTRARHGSVEAVTYYWHFVDAVWLAVLSAVYLLA